MAGVVDQRHRALLAGFEAHRGARGDVQAHAARGGTVEAQGAIRFSEVVVRADLDRAATAVLDDQRDRAFPRIDLDVGAVGKRFAGDHVGAQVLVRSRNRLLHGHHSGAVGEADFRMRQEASVEPSNRIRIPASQPIGANRVAGLVNERFLDCVTTGTRSGANCRRCAIAGEEGPEAHSNG